MKNLMYQIKRLIKMVALLVIAVNATAQQTGELTDPRDGKTYPTVKVGKQIWMAQDLNYYTGSGSWCYGDDSSNCDKYSRLYNWKAASEGCPAGWHLPSTDEWMQLINYLGGEKVAGGKLKAKNGWNNANISSTNSSSFSAVSEGYRNYGGVFGGLGTEGYWWSATGLDSGAWYFSLRYDDNVINKYGSNHRLAGFSVRCVKD